MIWASLTISGRVPSTTMIGPVVARPITSVAPRSVRFSRHATGSRKDGTDDLALNRGLQRGCWALGMEEQTPGYVRFRPAPPANRCACPRRGGRGWRDPRRSRIGPIPRSGGCGLADRCTDQTAEVATGRGVMAVERSSGAGGKGAALSWYLGAYPLDDDEALVVFDADNRLPEGALTRISDELEAGHDIVQCYSMSRTLMGPCSPPPRRCRIGLGIGWCNSGGQPRMVE